MPIPGPWNRNLWQKPRTMNDKLHDKCHDVMLTLVEFHKEHPRLIEPAFALSYFGSIAAAAWSAMMVLAIFIPCPLTPFTWSLWLSVPLTVLMTVWHDVVNKA